MVVAVHWSLLSLASMLDWSWYLNSNGHPKSVTDAIQTHAPTCILLVFNALLCTPLWSPERFQVFLSLGIMLAASALLLPHILENSHQLQAPSMPVASWVLEHYSLHVQSETPEHEDILAGHIAEQLVMVQEAAALQYAGTGCLAMFISLVPCGPFAPLASLIIVLGLTVVSAVRFKAMTRADFGMDPPGLSALCYSLVLVPVTISVLTRWRAERYQFLLFVRSRRQAELQLEQLRQEKERLDYERRFALHHIERSEGARESATVEVAASRRTPSADPCLSDNGAELAEIVLAESGPSTEPGVAQPQARSGHAPWLSGEDATATRPMAANKATSSRSSSHRHLSLQSSAATSETAAELWQSFDEGGGRRSEQQHGTRDEAQLTRGLARREQLVTIWCCT